MACSRGDQHARSSERARRSAASVAPRRRRLLLRFWRRSRFAGAQHRPRRPRPSCWAAAARRRGPRRWRSKQQELSLQRRSPRRLTAVAAAAAQRALRHVLHLGREQRQLPKLLRILKEIRCCAYLSPLFEAKHAPWGTRAAAPRAGRRPAAAPLQRRAPATAPRRQREQASRLLWAAKSVLLRAGSPLGGVAPRVGALKGSEAGSSGSARRCTSAQLAWS